jgi:hypothetical protein
MRSCRNQLTTPENLIHRTQTCLLCPMIRRSFVQILSGFLLPVPAQKSAVSQAVAPSGSLARFPFATGAISQSPFVSASNYDCPPFTAASKDAPYYKESATQYSPNSAPGCATPVTENQDFWRDTPPRNPRGRTIPLRRRPPAGHCSSDSPANPGRCCLRFSLPRRLNARRNPPGSPHLLVPPRFP